MSEYPSFGAELRRRRGDAGLSLGELAKRVHYSKGHLSKVESQRKPASIELARLCDAELDAQGELIRLVTAPTAESDSDRVPDGSAGVSPLDVGSGAETWVIGIGDTGGFFSPAHGSPPSAHAPVAALGMRLDHQVRADAAAAVAPFLARFEEARNLGQVAGPSAVFPLTIVETKTLQMLARMVPPEENVALLRLAARYAEFAGWMAQEAGDDRIAWWLTVRAVHLAEAAGDHSLRPYALVRRAEIALHQDDALSVIELASQAQQHDRTPVRIRGLAAQREAQGHALLGDSTACLRAIERSAAWLAEAAAVTQPGPALGTSRTPDLVALVTGWCLHDLGRASEAAEMLEGPIAQFRPTAHRARVRFQVRAALAHACAGNLARACELVDSVLDWVRILDSATIRHDLRSLSKVLGRWRTHPQVDALMPTLIALLQQRHGAPASTMLD